MATNNMHNLTTLIKRLEAATSRLEDMAAPASDTPQINGDAPTPRSAIADAAAIIPPSASSAVPAAPPAPKAEAIPEMVEDFDTFIATHVMPFVKASEGLGGAVAKQGAEILKAFEEQRTFLLITTKAKKPAASDEVYMELLTPTIKHMNEIGSIKDQNRGKPDYNQTQAVADGADVFGWVTRENKQWKQAEESLQATQFYGNKVIQQYKEQDLKQVEWIRSYYSIFKELGPWIQEHFPNGMLWNPKGLAPKDAAKSVAAASSPSGPPAPSAGGPPPPPPPPPGPPPVFDVTSSGGPPPPQASGSSGAAGIGAVFADLNKGDAVTKGLKKVNADQMTHKNPALRAGATVPERSNSQGSIGRAKSPVPPKARKPESMRTKKPPRKELDGSKWYIENYENEASPITIDAEITQSILISRCTKTTIIIKGKANAINIDNCNRLALVVDHLVSSVDVIKVANLELQVTGTLPTILMDQVDGASIYLSDESKNTEIYTSKSSSVNVNMIEGEEGDYKENALPEQLRTYIKDGKLISEIVEHAG